jgi:hypothetical protein
MRTKHCWARGITQTQTLQTLLTDEAVICRTELELSAAHFHSYTQTEKLIRKMVNQQQKGNRFDESVDGIVAKIIQNGMQQLITPIGASLIMKLNTQLQQKKFIN